VKFGPLPIAESEGVFLAQAIKRPGLTLRKGEWIGAGQIAALQAAHIAEIVAARIEPGEVDENTAALSLARSVAGANLHIIETVTGRCNLISGCAGVLVLDAAVIDRVNMVDEAITLATLAPFRRVAEGDMTATVKIIPFAVSAMALDRARVTAAEAPLRIAPFRPLRVGVVSTLLPGSKISVVAKALRTLDERLMPTGCKIAIDECAPHATDPLASALRRIEAASDLIVIFGARAITDRRDVVPSAIEKAGGRIEHFGMPVEPGNLLLLGSLPGEGEGKPVIGAPGCARSPKKNGFDFVLDRILAGLPMRSEDIRRMGVGGLLVENATHAQPGVVSPDASVE
jgi:molybdenum cofactor cytidylyltransferase